MNDSAPSWRSTFYPGQRVRCVQADRTGLKRGKVYTVAHSDSHALIAVKEKPGALFHPTRFTRLTEAEE